MKILSVNVASFGKLQNVTVDFQKGANVFRYDNGYGKTTLASFVRAMLYGFTYRRSGGASDVSAYLTWNSTEMIGGNMVVEHNGETYKVERFFGATAKQETLSVTNVKTRKALACPDGVGEYFLGLTAESYDRSAYFPQESVEIRSNENLSARLAGMVQNAADDFDKVQDNLRKYKKSLRYERGNGGEISRLEEEIFSLQHQIVERKNAQRERAQIDAQLRDIAAEEASLTKQVAAANAQLIELQKKSAACIPSEAEKVTRVKVADLQTKLARLGNFEQDKAACDVLAQQIERTPEAAKVQRPLCKPLLICGILLALAGVGVCFAHLIVGICAIAVGAILAAISFFVKPAAKTMQAGEKDALITEYFNLASKYVYCERLSYADVQKALWEKYAEYVGDKRELESLKNTLTDADEPQCADLKDEIAEQNEQINRMQARAISLSKEAGRLGEARSNLQTDYVQLQEQLDETKLQLASANRRYVVASKVADLLTQAKENLATSYLPDLCAHCEQLLSAVTGESYRLEMDLDFNVSVVVNGASRSLASFSRGIREITLLCFRLAISRLLFGGEIPFLIIDDAFVNFDEQNFSRATELLKSLTPTTQVIYFTCHKRLGALTACRGGE